MTPNKSFPHLVSGGAKQVYVGAAVWCGLDGAVCVCRQRSCRGCVVLAGGRAAAWGNPAIPKRKTRVLLGVGERWPVISAPVDGHHLAPLRSA